ncbi:MAG: NUDIX domain-containing protein [Chloroflexi bacterium]|nr:NUDIX domain-containing protein [Chloroflexota bacterium]
MTTKHIPTEEEVLAAWSGLGYYRRARSLKRAADAIVDEHRGRLPKEMEQLRALPGFGDYTAAAVGSIALRLPFAAVDGNVRRVTARLFAVSSREGHPRLADLASALLDRRRPGDWNQAMMELGATLCTPREPRCPVCPLRRYCAARELGKVESFPEPRPQPRTKHVDEVVVAVIRRGVLLLLQRGDGGSFSRMWELPRMDTREVGKRDLTPERVLAELTGLEAASFAPIGRTESTFTHHRIRTRLYRAESPTPGRIRRPRHVAHRWVKARDMNTLAASKAQKKLFALLRDTLTGRQASPPAVVSPAPDSLRPG